uniref:Putative nitrogen fixation protein NifY-like protein n=1 Tax=Magnetococcus massalia (strain MO-1) TaxID=451514 RepID=A0A1S7LDG6_MAGMO|nr:putative nitrogen fixation protein NifY-like protein [Candidatus Magnetococcus massalia]
MAKNTELALRMGIAAKQISDLEPKQLVTILESLLGLPFTPKKFSSLSLTDFTEAISKAVGATPDPGQLERAHTFLVKGPDEQILETLKATRNEIPKEPNSIRVACASNTQGQMDGHFGSCQTFEIYDVSPGAITHVESRSTQHLYAEKMTDDPAIKNDPRVALIDDSNLLFVVSIGGPAAAKVVRASMHPMKIAKGGEIDTLLGDLQQTLADSPPPWLAKAMAESVA